MVQSSPCLPISSTSCHLRPKPNLLPSIMGANLPFPFALHSKKWVIPKSSAPWSPPTTLLPKVWLWATCPQKHQNQWINASIGSNAAMLNVSFFISGVTASTIVQTTPANIIPQNITKQSVRFTSRTLSQVNEHPLQLHLTPTFHSSWSHNPRMIPNDTQAKHALARVC